MKRYKAVKQMSNGETRYTVRYERSELPKDWVNTGMFFDSMKEAVEYAEQQQKKNANWVDVAESETHVYNQCEIDLEIERGNLSRITSEWEKLLHEKNVFNKLPWYKRVWRVL